MYFSVINYLKRSTSILGDLSRTQIRVASLEVTGFQFGSAQVILGGDRNKILREYFDSYRSDVPLVFRNYLEEHSDKWKYNKCKLQSIWSDIYGDYCIFYLSHRACGYSMNKIIQLFDDNILLRLTLEWKSS